MWAGVALRQESLKPVKPTRTSPQKSASQEQGDQQAAATCNHSASHNNISVEFNTHP